MKAKRKRILPTYTKTVDKRISEIRDILAITKTQSKWQDIVNETRMTFNLQTSY